MYDCSKELNKFYKEWKTADLQNHHIKVWTEERLDNLQPHKEAYLKIQVAVCFGVYGRRRYDRDDPDYPFDWTDKEFI